MARTKKRNPNTAIDELEARRVRIARDGAELERNFAAAMRLAVDSASHLRDSGDHESADAAWTQIDEVGRALLRQLEQRPNLDAEGRAVLDELRELLHG